MPEIDIPGIGKIEVTAELKGGNIVVSITNRTAVNFSVDGELKTPVA